MDPLEEISPHFKKTGRGRGYSGNEPLRALSGASESVKHFLPLGD